MLNTAIFNGRLTATPEIKVTASGKAYTRFTIAVERPYKNKDNGRDADFFTCSTFGALAKIITDHFKKGEGIIVKGPLRNVRFTTKEGEIVNSSELLIAEFDFPVARPQEKSATIAKALSESELDDFEEILPANEVLPQQ